MPLNVEKLRMQKEQNVHAVETPKKLNKKYIVKYYHNYYDITEFIWKHPGGVNTLKGMNATDMRDRFDKAPRHSDAAMYLMQEYLITDSLNTNTNQQLNNDRDKRTPLDPKDNTYNIKESTNNKELSENMEYLVDWSQAMLPQISKISEHYNEWVHKPVDRPLKLFNAWYLEMFTKTTWWLIPVFWLPIIINILYNEVSLHAVNGKKSKLLPFTFYFLIGLMLWTLLEYALHRYIFHMPLKRTTPPWLCTIHFLIHGLHHKVPFDSKRLVFPPIPGIILAIIIYGPLSTILPRPRIMLAGSLFGYMCYDMIHYYLHYGNPAKGQHLYYMKRYHYQHHFAQQNLGYGISTSIWDSIFNTRIQLRYLKYNIKWK